MLNTASQANSLLLQFLSQAWPRAQFDEPRVSNMEATKQTPIGTHAITQDIGVSAIILGSSDTKPMPQAIELFRPLMEAPTTTCCDCGGALVGIDPVSKIPSDRRKNGRGLC